MAPQTMHGVILNRLLFTMWGWGELQRVTKELEGTGQKLPIPPEYLKLDYLVAHQFLYLINQNLPPGVVAQFQVGTRPARIPHGHVDRNGNKIPCSTAWALQQQPSYVLVDAWESDDGNTTVSTVWMGDVPRVFETRVLSTVEALHNLNIACATEEQSRQYHQAAIDAVRKFLSES